MIGAERLLLNAERALIEAVGSGVIVPAGGERPERGERRGDPVMIGAQRVFQYDERSLEYGSGLGLAAGRTFGVELTQHVQLQPDVRVRRTEGFFADGQRTRYSPSAFVSSPWLR